MGAGAGADSGRSAISITQNDTPVSDGFNFRNRNASTTPVEGALHITAGFVGMSRTSSSNVNYRVVGNSGSIVQTSNTPVNGNVGVFASTAAGSNFTAAGFAFYSIGESLDLALLGTRVSALYTAIGAAIP
jgi:hypothetical protein